MKTKNFILVFLMAVSSNVIMAQTDGQRQFYKDAEKVQETAKTYKYGNTDQAWKDGVAAKDLKIKLDEHGNAYWKVEKSESNSSSNSNTTPRSSGRTSTPSYTPPPSNNGYNNTVNNRNTYDVTREKRDADQKEKKDFQQSKEMVNTDFHV